MDNLNEKEQMKVQGGFVVAQAIIACPDCISTKINRKSERKIWYYKK